MEVMIKVLLYMFRLVEGRLSENFCKVFCVANVVGFAFCVLCMEGPYTLRAVIAGIILLLLACFFGSMLMLYRETREAIYEEDCL